MPLNNRINFLSKVLSLYCRSPLPLPKEKLTILPSGSFNTVNSKAKLLKFHRQCTGELMNLFEPYDEVNEFS